MEDSKLTKVNATLEPFWINYVVTYFAILKVVKYKISVTNFFFALLYNRCYICLVEYEEGDSVRILPCHHEFHKTCVDKWLKEIHRYTSLEKTLNCFSIARFLQYVYVLVDIDHYS